MAQKKKEDLDPRHRTTLRFDRESFLILRAMAFRRQTTMTKVLEQFISEAYRNLDSAEKQYIETLINDLPPADEKGGK